MLDLIHQAIDVYISLLKSQNLSVPSDNFDELKQQARLHENDLKHEVQMVLFSDRVMNSFVISHTIVYELAEMCHMYWFYPDHNVTFTRVFKNKLIDEIHMKRFEEILVAMMFHIIEYPAICIRESGKCTCDSQMQSVVQKLSIL